MVSPLSDIANQTFAKIKRAIIEFDQFEKVRDFMKMIQVMTM